MKFFVKSENSRIITPTIDIIQNTLTILLFICLILMIAIRNRVAICVIGILLIVSGVGLIFLLNKRFYLLDKGFKFSWNLYQNYVAIRKALFHNGIYTKFESAGKETKLLAQLPDVSFKISKNGLLSLVISNYSSYNAGLENINLNSVIKGYIVSRMYISSDGYDAIYELRDEHMEQPIIDTQQDLIDWFEQYRLKNGEPCFVFDNYFTRGFFSLGVFGRSGSGKSTLIKTLIEEMDYQGFEIDLIDPKRSDLAVLGEIRGYPYAVTPEDAVTMIERFTNELNERQEMMFKQMKQRKKTGLTPVDIGYQPKMLIIDEVGALMSAMPNTKDKPYRTTFINDIKELVFKARQLSMGVMICSQQWNAQLLGGSAVKEQMMLVQLGRNDVQTDMTVWGHKTESRNMPLGSGYAKSGTDVSEQYIWTPWLRYEPVRYNSVERK